MAGLSIEHDKKKKDCDKSTVKFADTKTQKQKLVYNVIH